MDNILHYWWLVFMLPVFAGIFRRTFFPGRYRDRDQHRDRDRSRGRDLQAPHDAPTYGPGAYGPPAAGSPTYGPPVAGYQPPGWQQTPQQPGQPFQADPLAFELARLESDHDAVNARWLVYELDLTKLIDFPMMSDVREPLTAAFLRAKRVADGLRQRDSEAPHTERSVAEYRDAVRDFEVAFDLAEREARRVKDAHFKDEERGRLSTARKLLATAEDESATPAERQLAYRRARKELDGLLLVPEEAVADLEQRIQAQLDAIVRPGSAGVPDSLPEPLLNPVRKAEQRPQAEQRPE
ncbi:hypothetical protein [Psychromicrobium xiongbiense]|uniref:hypothetical protein n=1 Tax=Psychromicrobium xiongbiense TaxID=3051184 RepID=UPI0025529340|nr:hypothetical protein [Psychromicrobium sp. YIM S02556]